ncbi:hypothetical protein GCM10011374_32850 [Kocuria dechangensis]|uniref:Uncharacterized protein n=1 Tax=Kocuria dechangensis TaxID=1176249 RepID=A0A917LZM9_9MICC|nr:hypothetical protein [Kocuria dechangensis]GGG66244.1 hypothetical protein GCM10011374_32850 [Kocuria dechangensis]
MSADTVLEAAEEKLFRAQRSFARQLLGLVAAELRRQHPEAVRLTVYADRYEYVVGDLLDADGFVVRPDPGRCVVARRTADDPLGGTVTVAAHDVAALLRRALTVYEGPPEKVLRADPHTGVLHLDLTRA